MGVPEGGGMMDALEAGEKEEVVSGENGVPLELDPVEPAEPGCGWMC